MRGDFLQEFNVSFGIGKVTGIADADTNNGGEAARKGTIDRINDSTFIAGGKSDFKSPAGVGVTSGGVLESAAIKRFGGVDPRLGGVGTGDGRVFSLGKFVSIKIVIAAHGVEVESAHDATVSDGLVKFVFHAIDDVGAAIERFAEGIEIAELGKDKIAFTGEAGLGEKRLYQE